jgi:site-specific recombinase XerD
MHQNERMQAIKPKRTDTLPAVTLTGKGRKTRVTPLWDDTVAILSHYVQFRKQFGIESQQLFVNVHGKPMTRFGIARRVTQYAQRAAAQCPSLQDRDISPHTFRHTTALHLVEAGNDLAVVKDWLGHAHIKTTCQYLEVSVERKRKALEKLPPPDADLKPELPQWTQPAIMEFLVRCSRGHYVA